MFLHVGNEFETTVTQNTMSCNLPDMAYQVYCLVIPDTRPKYFIHQESSLPAKCLQQDQKLLSIVALPLPIPSTRNHLVILQGIINIARAPFANLPLTIPSTRNHHFHVYSTKIMLVIAGLSFTVLSIRNCFSHNAASTGQGSVGCCRLPLYIPSNRNHLCLLHEALSWARIMFGVNDAHLTNSSTRSNHHLLYTAFNRFMITLGVVGLLLTIPSTRNLSFPSMACSGSYWTWLISLFPFPPWRGSGSYWTWLISL